MSHLVDMTNYVTIYQYDVKCQTHRCALSGAEQPIAPVCQPRQDVAVVVELAVERGGEDGDVGVGLEHAPHALGRGDEAEEADPLGAGVLERAHGVRRRAAGGEHGIEHEEIARVFARWDFEIVVDRLERVVLTVDADVADAGRRDELRDALDHAESGAQDRHEGELLPRYADAPHALERGFHLRGLERQVFRHLVRHEHGDLVHELLEIPRGGVLVPQDRELVLNQRVIEHREVGEFGVRHGPEGTAHGRVTPRDRGTDATPGRSLPHNTPLAPQMPSGRTVVTPVTLAREDACHDTPCRGTSPDWTALWRRSIERPGPDRHDHGPRG